MTVTALPLTPRRVIETEPAIIPYGGPKGAATETILKALFSDESVGFVCGDAECDFEADTYGAVFAHRRAHGPSNQARAQLAAARELVKAADKAKKAKATATKPTPAAKAAAAPVVDVTRSFEAMTPQQRLKALAAQQEAVLAEIKAAEAAEIEAAKTRPAEAPEDFPERTPVKVLVQRIATLERRSAKWQERALTAEAIVKRYETAAANLAKLAG